MNNRPVTFLVFIALFPCIKALSQVHRPETSASPKDPSKYTLSNIPAVDATKLDDIKAIDMRSEKERLRSDRYSIGNGLHPLYDPRTHRISYGIQYVSHLDNNPLPIAASDVVAIGTISSSATHVTTDKTYLYSTYTFHLEKILKQQGGELPSSITLERLGGVAKFPGGKEVMLGESGRGLPETARKYLLFLTYHKDSDSFEILTGYAVVGTSVTALDESGDGLDGQDISMVTQRMRTGTY